MDNFSRDSFGNSFDGYGAHRNHENGNGSNGGGTKGSGHSRDDVNDHPDETRHDHVDQLGAKGDRTGDPDKADVALVGGPRKDETNIDPDDPVVPDSACLADAAQRALDDEVAFILLHQDNPEEFVTRLDRLLDRLRAAISLRGPHQARAIRTVLRIPAFCWMAGYRFDEWGAILSLARARARDLKDAQLDSEVIAAWGKYLTLKQAFGPAGEAFEWSAEKLDEADIGVRSGDTRRLLLAIDHFNVEVTTKKMSVENVLERAETLLERARRFAYPYFQARVYHALSRYFRFVKRDNVQTFMYGQLALSYYLPEPEDWGLVAQLLFTLLAALELDETGTWVYRQRLLGFLDDIIEQRHSCNPWLRARLLQTYAVQHYHQENYAEGRRYGLQAWWLHWRFGERRSCATTQHVVGLAERDMRRWQQAEWHLTDVLAQYDALDDAYHYALAHFSRSMIPVQQGDWSRAEAQLLESRAQAEQRLRDPDQRKRMLSKIDKELARVREQLS